MVADSHISHQIPIHVIKFWHYFGYATVYAFFFVYELPHWRISCLSVKAINHASVFDFDYHVECKCKMCNLATETFTCSIQILCWFLNCLHIILFPFFFFFFGLWRCVVMILFSHVPENLTDLKEKLINRGLSPVFIVPGPTGLSTAEKHRKINL